MRHKFSFHLGRLRATFRARPSGRLALPVLFGLSGLLPAACSGGNAVRDDAMRYDFFFTSDGIRIVGHGQMPPAGLDLSYEERRDKCIELARQHANSKWLGVTEKTIELQTLWLDRLRRGARGPWQRCLDEGRLLRYLPDAADACSIVVEYRCDPREW